MNKYRYVIAINYFIIVLTAFFVLFGHLEFLQLQNSDSQSTTNNLLLWDCFRRAAEKLLMCFSPIVLTVVGLFDRPDLKMYYKGIVTSFIIGMIVTSLIYFSMHGAWYSYHLPCASALIASSLVFLFFNYLKKNK